MMRPTTATVLLLVLLTALCACGGSGSSGFDVTPLSEDALIETVLASGQCADSGSTLVCSAAGPVFGTPGPGQTPNGGREVTLDLPPGDEIACTLATDSSACLLTLSFSSSGFPADAVYRTAVRSGNATWVVGEVATPSGIDVFSVPLAVPAEAGTIQIAVLVFNGGAGGSAGPTETLAHTGAVAAFVSDSLSVESLR